MKQSQFYYLLRRGLFSAGSAIIKNGLVMFNKFTTAGLNFPAQGSAEFNGTSDYIDIGEIAITEGSVSAWVYNDGDTNYMIMGGNSSSGKYRGYIWFKDNNKITFRYDEETYGSTSPADLTIPVNEWFHYAMSRGNSCASVKHYINGSEVHSVTNSGTGLFSIQVFGRAYNSSYSLPGNLANVAIWNRALTSDEINSVMWKSYEGLEGAESNGLQAWYSLDDITSPAASLANMEQLATDKDATIENKAAVTAAINALS